MSNENCGNGGFCGGEKFTVELQRYGISFTEIADILAKWGPAVLNVVINGLRNGITLALLREILETFGPLVLESVVYLHTSTPSTYEAPRPKSVLHHTGKLKSAPAPAMVGADRLRADVPPIFVAEEVDSFDVSNPIVELIKQFLPALIDKYGPQILAWLKEAIMVWLASSKNKAKLTAALNDLLHSI